MSSTWTFHSGQICTSPTRLVVHRSRYDEVVSALAGMAGKLKVGDPLERDTVLGPVITGAHRDRVEGFVRSAVDEGAETVAGGKRPELDTGFYVAPTLLAGGHNDMLAAREEIFGPVIIAMPFDDDDEAVAISNDSAYGLYSYVFGGDTGRAMGIAKRLQSGKRRHQHPPAQPRGRLRWVQVLRCRPRRRPVGPPRLLRDAEPDVVVVIPPVRPEEFDS